MAVAKRGRVGVGRMLEGDPAGGGRPEEAVLHHGDGEGGGRMERVKRGGGWRKDGHVKEERRVGRGLKRWAGKGSSSIPTHMMPLQGDGGLA